MSLVPEVSGKPRNGGILALPTETIQQILTYISKLDSLCLGLTHTRLYKIHWNTHGKTGLLEGLEHCKKQNRKFGLECHVRIGKWCEERGLRVGYVSLKASDEVKGKGKGKEVVEGKVTRLVSEEEWAREEERYLAQLALLTRPKRTVVSVERPAEIVKKEKVDVKIEQEVPLSFGSSRQFLRPVPPAAPAENGVRDGGVLNRLRPGGKGLRSFFGKRI